MQYSKEPDYVHNTRRPVGVLLVNLGTPDGLGYGQLRRYLREFLSDPRVVEKNRLLWWFLLNGPILTFAPFRSRRNYARIWDYEKGESPLRIITRAQAQKLQIKFGMTDVKVAWAMRYGTPSVAMGLDELKQAGCDRVLLVPLYPQYSAVTTASVCDAAFDALKTTRWMPTLRVAAPYHDHPAYITALADSVRAYLAERAAAGRGEPDVLVTSYHGLPQRYFDAGDPYHCHCQKTTRLLREALGWDETKVRLSFQSKFGREKWLEPATDTLLEQLPGEGMKDIAVITPGFAADCVETLEEMAISGRKAFLAAGGEQFHFIPCLNASAGGVAMLETLCREEMAGWIDASGARAEGQAA